MIFSTTVTLQEGDSFLYSADAAAAQVLAALGGDPTNDSSTVYVMSQLSGSAGVPPTPPAALAAPPLEPPAEATE
jgi:hypothetical protein